jgi:Competence protein CoiA-like family
MISKLVALGAINKKTQIYEYPRIANKKDDYCCPDCSQELILCQGTVNKWHFRHHSDKTNLCVRYSEPTESQIHKDAKMILQQLIQNNRLIVYRPCHECKQEEEFELPAMTDTMSVSQEYSLSYGILDNGCEKTIKGIADVALVDDGGVVAVFEIYHTHQTQEDARFEPWFEFNARDVIELVGEKEEKESVRISCIRHLRCDECVETIRTREQERYDRMCRLSLSQLIVDKLSLEFFVRYRLGQRFTQKSGRKSHLRFDFHADNPTTQKENNRILALFRDYLPYDIFVYSYKGSLYCSREYMINHWGGYDANIHYSDKCILDGNGMGTVQIIVKLLTLTHCNLERLKNAPPTSDDEGSVYRSMRYAKQEINHSRANHGCSTLDRVGIPYSIKNHIMTVEHPTIKNCVIRYSTTKSLVYIREAWSNAFRGQWMKTPLTNIILWYKTEDGTLHVNQEVTIQTIPKDERPLFVGILKK